MFDASDSYCRWTDQAVSSTADGTCVASTPKLSFQVVVFIIVFTTICTASLQLLTDRLFLVLLSPLKSSEGIRAGSFLCNGADRSSRTVSPLVDLDPNTDPEPKVQVISSIMRCISLRSDSKNSRQVKHCSRSPLLSNISHFVSN